MSFPFYFSVPRAEEKIYTYIYIHKTAIWYEIIRGWKFGEGEKDNIRIANNILACRKKGGRKKKKARYRVNSESRSPVSKVLDFTGIGRYWTNPINGATAGKQKQLMPMRFWHRLDIEIIDVSFGKKKNSIIEIFFVQGGHNKRGEKLKRTREIKKEVGKYRSNFGAYKI